MKKQITYRVEEKVGQVEIRKCDVCGVGIGKTHYPDGVFKHANGRKHELYGYEMCEECAEKYSNNVLSFVVDMARITGRYDDERLYQ